MKNISHNFKTGDHVEYIPVHANSASNVVAMGECGIVSSINEKHVFVVFTGDVDAKACNPNDLIFDWRII